MILTGIGDEAGNTIDAQIAATKELGWKHIEARGVEVPGFPKANLHDVRITPVHENCMNYGGMSWKHALELLDRAPGLEWVFDTANPVFNPDRSQPKPWPRQDAWEFWEHVRDHVVHIHVKDATWNPA